MALRSKVVLSGIAGAVAVVLLATAANAAGTPGGTGIGDRYYPLDGNGGYHVSHYDLHLAYQPSTDRLSGTTTLTARTTKALTRFDLDFFLKVTSLTINGTSAGFVSNSNGELVVTPAAPLAKGAAMTIVVKYDDIPSNPDYQRNGANSWNRTSTGALAVNEPHIAPWWFPSNDHPTDKATFNVSVAVPSGTEALSNGVLVSKQTQPNGMVRWNWHSEKPANTYCTFLVIGQYDDLRTATTPSGQTFISAYSNSLTGNGAAARASVQRTPEIIAFEATQFGPYPFEAQGGIVTGNGLLGFALENQTRPVYDGSFWGATPNTYVVAHENAHQWFGDSVSVHRWADIWLAEGFATYAEWLWSEHLGQGTAAANAQFAYTSRPASDPFWQVLVADPGPSRQFDNAVYDRGAMALQALRTAVGDSAFFSVLRTWASSHRYGNGSTAQFIALAESTSGQQLDALFNTWLFTRGKPATGPNGLAAPARMAEPRSYRQIQETHARLAGR